MNDKKNAAILAEMRALRRDLKFSTRQLQARRQRAKSHRWTAAFTEVGVIWGIGLAIAAIHQISLFFQGQVNLFSRVLRQDVDQPVAVGQAIAGYEVIAGYGMRSHPTSGQRYLHTGIGIAIPAGTSLYFPAETGMVECKTDVADYGTYALITPSDVDQRIQFLAAHLQSCRSGTYQLGQPFAKSGQPSNSTTSHLYWEQLRHGKPIPPLRSWLSQLLRDDRQASTPEMVQPEQLIRLRRAIIGMESNGDFQAINPDSGALGYAQVMPENLSRWSKAALGYSVTIEQFLDSPELQIQVIDHRLKRYFEKALREADGDEAIAVRRVASAWYSGHSGWYDDPTPQFYNNRAYPSIRDYTLRVLERYRDL